MLEVNDRSEIVTIDLTSKQIQFLIMQADASISACKKGIKNWETDVHVQGLIKLRETLVNSITGPR